MSGRTIVLTVWVGSFIAAIATSSVLSQPSAVADEIGARTVGGMEIEAELEEPEEGQMLMGGQWMIQEPAQGDTHHFEVALIEPKFGGRIPYAKVTATFLNLKTGGKFAKRLDPMYGKNFHYGANVRLAHGTYRVTVKVQPPALMRVGEALNKWLKPVTAEFRFTV